MRWLVINEMTNGKAQTSRGLGVGERKVVGVINGSMWKGDSFTPFIECSTFEVWFWSSLFTVWTGPSLKNGLGFVRVRSFGI